MIKKQTIDCLTADAIEGLAHGEFQAAELARIEEHIGSCEHCRDLLESTSIDAQWRDEVLPVLRRPCDAPGFLRDLTNEAREAQSLDAVLQLLGPTDDPHKIGRIGTYEVIGVIGRGGMGVVFKALDAALNRFVAIKMLLPHLAVSGAARKRFAREGQAAAAVIDDNVLPIYSVSEWQGVPYFVMQYSRGMTLQTRIQEQGPLALAEILRIGMQTARGLAAAHSQGLVHRDVKPSNILLDGDVERVLLSDFGLARAVDDASLTRTGVIAGTPQYMSPEQVTGDTVDARSDLFSLGCVLYALCSGRPPFRADNSYAILRQITDQQPRPIREVNPDIPDWFVDVVSKLMAKSPCERFASAAELAGVLEQCLAHVQQPHAMPLPIIPGFDPQRSLRSFSSYKSRTTKIIMSVATLAAILAVFVFAQVDGTNSPETQSQSSTSNATEGGETNGPAKAALAEKSVAESQTNVTPAQTSEPEKVAHETPVDVREILVKGLGTPYDHPSVRQDLVLRIGACMGGTNEKALEDTEGLVELWEFTKGEVHRVNRYFKDGKPLYYRIESCFFDTSNLCQELLDGHAIEIQTRNGTGPYTALAGTNYKRGSRSIKLELKGQTILDLHESNGAVPDVYRETDAKAFGDLYERLASQARWLLGPGVGEISKLQWKSSGVAAKVDSTAGTHIVVLAAVPDGLKSMPEGLISPRYGVFEMGPTGAKSSYYVIVDSPAGHPATLYVNRKGDGEMSKERGHAFTAKQFKRRDGTDGINYEVYVTIEIPFEEGIREATLKFSRLDPKRFRDYYDSNLFLDADFGYEGKTIINGRPVPTVIIDEGCSGEAKRSDPYGMGLARIWFDFNANGKTDTGEIMEEGYFTLDEKWWSVRSIGNDGAIRVVQAFQRDSNPTDYSVDSEAIKIWLVGNPSYGDTPGTKVPDVLKAKAKELGYRLNVQAFKAEGFHNVYWDSLAKGDEPDVLVYDSSDILDGVETVRGKFTGILEKQGTLESLFQVIDKPGLFGGESLLVTSSHNHSKAKDLVAKYTATPLIPNIEDRARLGADDKIAVSKLAVRAYRDLAKKDIASLKKISDELLDTSSDWGVVRSDSILINAVPGIVDVLDVRGTNRLAFVVASSPFSLQPLMLVFRRSTGDWKLSTVVDFNEDIFRLLDLLENADDKELETIDVETPLIVSPSDGAQLKRYPDPPGIEWITSGDLAIMYMVESKPFQVGQLHLLQSESFDSKDVIQIQAPFDGGANPYRWRVWAIGASGDAAVSEWRTINYTN